jgi:hypothetical protein
MKLFKTIAACRNEDGEWVDQYDVEFTEEEIAFRIAQEAEHALIMKQIQIDQNENDAKLKIQEASLEFADRLLMASSEEQDAIKSEYKALKESIIAEKKEKNDAITQGR